MPVFWLDEDDLNFPPAQWASPEGVLAIGGDLSPERLLNAYSNGIFPWFNPSDPIIWWSPDPRFVLFPDELKVAKSMRPYFNQGKFRVTFDEQFERVMRECQARSRENKTRRRPTGTWITEDMITAYVRLHELGFAHSVEVWQGEQLVGGLYGLALGKIYFGESMFSLVSNASKFGFITLVRRLKSSGYTLIDCQQETNYLESMGARAIPRQSFLDLLEKNRAETSEKGKWRAED